MRRIERMGLIVPDREAGYRNEPGFFGNERPSGANYPVADRERVGSLAEAPPRGGDQIRIVHDTVSGETRAAALGDFMAPENLRRVMDSAMVT